MEFFPRLKFHETPRPPRAFLGLRALNQMYELPDTGDTGWSHRTLQGICFQDHRTVSLSTVLVRTGYKEQWHTNQIWGGK